MPYDSAERKRKIEILQENLSSIRKIAGWTAEELGDRIGVTKQTISNLENRKSPMNFTQYIAIRAVLDCEIEEHPENEALSKTVNILLENGETLKSEDYKQIKSSLETVAAAAAGGVTGAALTGLFAGIVSPVVKMTGLALLSPVGGLLGLGVGAAWLKKLIGRK